MRRAQASMLLALFTGAGFAAPVEGLPDPTRPADLGYIEPVELERRTAEWRLTGVKVSPDSRLAIINGQLVGVGARIGSVEVVEITPTGVVLLQDGRSMRVALTPARVKQPVKPDE